MRRLNVGLDDQTYARLQEKKGQDGYAEEGWLPWLRYLTRGVPTDKEFTAKIREKTRDILAKLWMENLAQNIPKILEGRSISDIHPGFNADFGYGKEEHIPAVIVAAGPSVREKKHLELLAGYEEKRRYVVFACDRMLAPCLGAGIIPDFVACVDGHRKKIPAWFRSKIVSENGSKTRGLFNTTVAPQTIEAAEKAGIPVYWFSAMMDDFNVEANFSRLMYYLTKKTAINCIGNVGTSTVALAYYFGCSPIVLTGFNFGYTKDTPIEETCYYETFQELNPKLTRQEFYSAFHLPYKNPHTGTDGYTDKIMMHYRDGFNWLSRTMVADGTELINATEDGILYEDPIRTMPLAEWLQEAVA